MKLNRNGHAPALAIPSDVVITEKPAKAAQPRKPKHVPTAPAGTVPSGEVPWRAVHGGKTETVVAQTWFFARAAAMALFGCGPHQVEVRRA